MPQDGVVHIEFTRECKNHWKSVTHTKISRTIPNLYGCQYDRTGYLCGLFFLQTQQTQFQTADRHS